MEFKDFPDELLYNIISFLFVEKNIIGKELTSPKFRDENYINLSISSHRFHTIIYENFIENKIIDKKYYINNTIEKGYDLSIIDNINMIYFNINTTRSMTLKLYNIIHNISTYKQLKFMSITIHDYNDNLIVVSFTTNIDKSIYTKVLFPIYFHDGIIDKNLLEKYSLQNIVKIYNKR